MIARNNKLLRALINRKQEKKSSKWWLMSKSRLQMNCNVKSFLLTLDQFVIYSVCQIMSLDTVEGSSVRFVA